MVDLVPARKLSLMIISENRSDGLLLLAGFQSCLSEFLSRIDLFDDVKQGYAHYANHHPDVVVTLGLESAKSEALIIHIRKVAGQRHAGIVVMAPVTESFDRLAQDNYSAGADDVISSNTSVLILKAKIISVFNLKVASDNLRTAIHKLHKMTMTDELTGLANMRGFLRLFGCSMERNSSLGVGVVMMDLDKFKKINDSTNHMVGSHIIKSVGKILGNNPYLGEHDFAARYGGDEFIMILHGDSFEEQKNKAEAIRKLIWSSVFEFQSFRVQVTASLGLSWVPKGFNGRPEDLVKVADAMLYKSKEAGRNQLTSGILSSQETIALQSESKAGLLVATNFQKAN